MNPLKRFILAIAIKNFRIWRVLNRCKWRSTSWKKRRRKRIRFLVIQLKWYCWRNMQIKATYLNLIPTEWIKLKVSTAVAMRRILTLGIVVTLVQAMMSWRISLLVQRALTSSLRFFWMIVKASWLVKCMAATSTAYALLMNRWMHWKNRESQSLALSIYAQTLRNHWLIAT